MIIADRSVELINIFRKKDRSLDSLRSYVVELLRIITMLEAVVTLPWKH